MDRLEAFLRTQLGAHPRDLAEHASRELSIPRAEVEAEIARLTTAGVFDEFVPPHPDPERDQAFAKTSFQASLAQHPGEDLVSRSQAKRLMARCERFREVTIDFVGVEFIGQAFADEIFRVFAGQHPGLTIQATNTNAVVERMIQRVRGNGSPPQVSGS